MLISNYFLKKKKLEIQDQYQDSSSSGRERRQRSNNQIFRYGRTLSDIPASKRIQKRPDNIKNHVEDLKNYQLRLDLYHQNQVEGWYLPELNTAFTSVEYLSSRSDVQKCPQFKKICREVDAEQMIEALQQVSNKPLTLEKVEFEDIPKRWLINILYSVNSEHAMFKNIRFQMKYDRPKQLIIEDDGFDYTLNYQQFKQETVLYREHALIKIEMDEYDLGALYNIILQTGNCVRPEPIQEKQQDLNNSKSH